MWLVVLLLAIIGLIVCIGFAWAMATIEEATRRLQRERVVACKICGHQCSFSHFKQYPFRYKDANPLIYRLYSEYPIYKCNNCGAENGAEISASP